MSNEEEKAKLRDEFWRKMGEDSDGLCEEYVALRTPLFQVTFDDAGFVARIKLVTDEKKPPEGG